MLCRVMEQYIKRWSETWTMTVQHNLLLRRFERKILRKVFGQHQNAERNFRTCISPKLEQLYNSPEIVREMKASTLRGARHLQKSQNHRLIKWYWKKHYTDKNQRTDQDSDGEQNIRLLVFGPHSRLSLFGGLSEL